MPCSFGHERALQKQGILVVAGIDEAGRGPLAGPVVAAAVVFLEHRRFNGLDDSKKLTPEIRLSLYERITSAPHVQWAVSSQDVATIDAINILRATHKAMREALGALSSRPDYVLTDGFPVPGLGVPASPYGRVTRSQRRRGRGQRDRQGHPGPDHGELSETWPQYGFAEHKGYATPEHSAALVEHGPTPIHRFSFSPVAQPELF